MKIDIEFYRGAKDDFIANLRRRNVKTFKQLNDELSLYCSCFGLPVFAAIQFCREEFPQFEAELVQKKQVIVLFYGYEE